jgi:hypothetical protein
MTEHRMGHWEDAIAFISATLGAPFGTKAVDYSYLGWGTDFAGEPAPVGDGFGPTVILQRLPEGKIKITVWISDSWGSHAQLMPLYAIIGYASGEEDYIVLDVR